MKTHAMLLTIWALAAAGCSAPATAGDTQDAPKTALTRSTQRTTARSPKPERKRSRIYVNDQELPLATVNQLEAAYRTPIAPGRYWYDPVSGLWGYAGGPAAGQISAGLDLGGRLKAKASGGGTGIYVNGRELHPLERAYLVRTYGAHNVKRGRFWMNARGVGGYEGQRASFDLGAGARSQRRSLTGGYSVTGGVLGGGGVVGYTDSSGTSITCGPDGGCF